MVSMIASTSEVWYCFSDWAPVKELAIPQSSAFGPLLFLFMLMNAKAGMTWISVAAVCG